MRPPSRHATPILVRDGSAPVTLTRLELGRGEDGDRREAFVQELVHGTIRFRLRHGRPLQRWLVAIQ